MNSAKTFSIKLLGSPTVQGDDRGPISGRAVQRHRLALLSLLALSPGRTASRDRVHAYLWPESDLEHARQLLNQAVYQLRKALGEDAILTAGDELRLNTDVLRVDVVSFENALTLNDPATAVTLYQGPLLDGFYLSDASEYEQRIERERQRLAGLYAKALEMLAETAERESDLLSAVAWWKTLAEHDRYDSRIALRLMQALDAGGNRAGALQHAATHARLLQEEFGIAPAPEVSAFIENLRSEPIPPAAPPPIPREAQDHRPSVADRETTALEAYNRAGVSDGQDASVLEHAAFAATTLVTRQRLRLRYALIAIVAAMLGASAFWAVSRNDDMQWLMREAIPQIEEFLAVADWERAFALTREADRRVPGSPEVTELWPRVSWRVSIPSEPTGAMVSRQAYGAPIAEWEEIGRTPLQNIRIPYGLSRIRIELAGYRPLIRTLGGAHINWNELKPINPDFLLVGPETYRLDPDSSLPRDVVRVTGGTVTIEGDRLTIDDFLLEKHEVTNAQYKRFVASGGYQRAELWDPIVVGNRSVAWSEAMKLFVDRTGRPGPSTWEAGDYRHGEDDLPVSGVSWYEAAAYARFVGRELPTAHHWQLALANATFPWLLPASNFSGERLRAVGEGRAITHVEVYDLAGNVREWTSTGIGDQRIILGGSWNDPYYIAGTTDTSAPPIDRSAGNGIRLAITSDVAANAARLRAPLSLRTTAAPVSAQIPVPDDVYSAYSRVFDYDRRALNAIIEDVDTTRVWIRERISFDAAYGSERMLLHLYVPTSGKAPHQTVVYWPGWDTFALDDPDEYFAKQADFIVKSGRAVAFPIYRGIFERRVGNVRTRPPFGSAEYRDNTIYTVKDLRRTLDYLESRSEFDRAAFAYFGYSWGGVNGPVALAQEDRIRVSIIKIGLLPPMAATPEVDPLHALPRVHVPTLMFSGEFDPMVPVENARRYFELLGTAPAQKRQVIAIGGHFIPRPLVIRETLDWLDHYLGEVSR